MNDRTQYAAEHAHEAWRVFADGLDYQSRVTWENLSEQERNGWVFAAAAELGESSTMGAPFFGRGVFAAACIAAAEAYDKTWRSDKSFPWFGTIGWAVELLQLGRRIRRSGWNGKGMWLELVRARDWEVERCLDAERADFVVMHTADSKWVPWFCSQTDILATDWELAKL